MNNEKDNLGVSNDLPPMGTMVDNNLNKLNLPPISSFTNFDDNNSVSTNNLSSNNFNDSIFNLMDQFDQVSANGMNSSSKLPNQQSQINNFQENSINNNFMNQTVNTVDTMQSQVQSQNQGLNMNDMNHINSLNQEQAPSPVFNMANKMPQVVSMANPQGTSSTFNINNESNNSVNNSQIQPQAFNKTDNNVNLVQEVPAFNMDKQVPSSVNNMVNGQEIKETPIYKMGNENNQFVNEVKPQIQGINMNVTNQSVSNINQEGFTQQTQLSNINNTTTDSLGNQSLSNMNDIQNIATEPMNEDFNELLSHAPIINNQENELISKFSMDESPVIDVNSQNQGVIPSMPTNNSNYDTTNNKEDNKKGKVVKEKKVKSKKMLFIILLVVTILLLGAVAIICYFKFFKTDKLVCSLQDYSNEQFLVEESMIMNFKGSNLVNANLKRNLIFMESYMDSKTIYLEELRNQFEGLGFDVSYSENDTGFEINMNFTKKDLENWYGEELKNSSKNNMLKEMKDVGYTCK